MESKVIFNNIKEYFLSKPKFISRIFFVVLISAAAFALFQQYKYLKEVEKSEANLLLKKAENSIEQSIHSALLSTITLALSVNDDGIPEEFESLGRQLVDENLYVDGIELVPNGIVKYVYPYETNKSALNYDILADQKTNREANNAINNKKFYIAGPLVLKQGGAAVIGRLPIFRNNKFWGFSAVIVKLETLFKNTGINTPTISGFYYQFSKVNPNTLIEENFLPIPPNANTTYLARKKFQESNWIITVIPIDKYGILKGLLLNGIIYLLMALGFSTLLKNLLSRPAILEQLVLERTKELKNSKKEIQDSEENYRTMVERVSDGFVSLDKNWVYTYMNEKAAEMVGRVAENMIGKNMWEEFPELKVEPINLYPIYTKAVNEQESINVEYFYTPFNKWFETHIYPSKEGLSIYFQDITDRKISETKLQESLQRNTAFLNAIPDLIFVINDAGIFTDFHNPKNTSTYTNPDLFLGNQLIKTLPAELAEETMKYVKKTLKGDETSIHNYQLSYSKSINYFEARYAAISDTEVLVIVRDISDRKIAEAKIKKLNSDLELRVEERTKELKSVNKELESFSYSVSHDLRAPLRSIAGFSQILLEDYKDKLDKEANRLLNTIKNNTEKMGTLIDGLLNFSRLGRKAVIRTNIETSQIVKVIIEEESQRNKGRNIEWVINELPPTYGDSNLILRVWENLIINAVKYTGKNEQTRIEIGSYKLDNTNVFYVKDNGVGFDMKYKDKLFDVFQRLHSQQEFEGNGLGLANVHKIVNKHGGKVWAEAELGKGATFFFTIPINILHLSNN